VPPKPAPAATPSAMPSLSVIKPFGL
jgi:hypothetical protein